MQENNAEMSNRGFTLTERTKEEKLLVACYKLVRYKLRKLQIAGVEVISLAQALNVIKDFLDKEKAITITTFNARLLQAKGKVEDVILS